MTFHAIVFDVDGTLADTEEAHRCAFNEAFCMHGLGWHWSKGLYAQLLSISGGKERLRSYIDLIPMDDAEKAHLHAQVVSLHRTKTDIYTSALSEGKVPLRDGVGRLLDECRKDGIKLAIASTTTAANIEMLLTKNLGADSLTWFSVIGAGDVVARKKPAPDIYQWTLERLGESADHCVAVEDSANGLTAAKAAGLYTVVTPTQWTAGEDFSTADLLLPYLGSMQHPLTEIVASQLGAPQLGVPEIRRLLGRPTAHSRFRPADVKRRP